MWLICSFVTSLISLSIADTSSTYFFCSDMTPQPHIIIEQLMGMWYGIEIISHNSEEHYVRMGTSCPILHLSEGKDIPPAYNPLYKNYNYGYNYGEQRPPIQSPTDRTTNYDQYGRSTQYPPYNRNYNSRRYGTKDYNAKRTPSDMKRIRIWWDENGTGTEYNLKYNINKPGFWISSGPQNGSELEPLYSDFAGTVQVIKAVGSHLLLTFCHRLPEQELFTILLSRENKLGLPDIHSVHNLLNRKGLSANAVKKVCWNGSNKSQISLGALFITAIGFVFLRF